MKWAVITILVAVGSAAVIPDQLLSKLSAVAAHTEEHVLKAGKDVDNSINQVAQKAMNTLNAKSAPALTVQRHLEEAPVVPPLKEAGVGYAVDLSASTSLSTFQCIRQQGYAVAFIRAYNPAGNGAYDSNGALNVKNANSAGLGTEVYMTPQPASSKSAAQQIDEMYQGLQSGGINVRTIWIQVTSPINWPNSQSTNQAFISSLVSRARQYNLAVGIYTSTYDWNQITNAWNNLPNTSLWYWAVNGNGPNGETSPNFSDFRAFGCWTTPSVKQFGQAESVCGVAVNRYATLLLTPPAFSDVYAVSMSEKAGALVEDGMVVAGNNIKML